MPDPECNMKNLKKLLHKQKMRENDKKPRKSQVQIFSIIRKSITIREIDSLEGSSIQPRREFIIYV